MTKYAIAASTVFLLVSLSLGQGQAAPFDGITKWNASLSALDATALKAMYSTDPPAKSIEKEQKQAADISPEIDFWQQVLSSGVSDVAVSPSKEEDRNGLHLVQLEVSMKVETPNGSRTRYVMEQQAWQYQGDTWRIVLAKHSDVLKMKPALDPNPNLYDKNADAKAEIKEALRQAAKAHQRVILVFGGNWCYDCHVLDQAFHQEDVASILEKNYQVVHVDVGEDEKKNSDLTAEYKIPLNKGVPALAILGPDGKLLYSQQNGEWESARSMDPDDVIAFLNKWKP